MVKFYVRWQLNPAMLPPDPKDLGQLYKFWLWMLDMCKDDVKAGTLKDWGMYSDLSGGYALYEAASAQDLNTALMKWTPYVNFDARPVLTLDQAIASVSTLLKKP